MMLFSNVRIIWDIFPLLLELLVFDRKFFK